MFDFMFQNLSSQQTLNNIGHFPSGARRVGIYASRGHTDKILCKPRPGTNQDPPLHWPACAFQTSSKASLAVTYRGQCKRLGLTKAPFIRGTVGIYGPLFAKTHNQSSNRLGPAQGAGWYGGGRLASHRQPRHGLLRLAATPSGWF